MCLNRKEREREERAMEKSECVRTMGKSEKQEGSLFRWRLSPNEHLLGLGLALRKCSLWKRH